MKIKKGDVFECIKDVVMVSGYTAFLKGKHYTSDNDECITDESGDEFYHWIVSTENFFRKLSDVEVAERKNPINENIGQLGDNNFQTIANNVVKLLEYKNKKYGKSALNPIEIFNGKSKVGQRIDDKLSRIKNSEVLAKNDVVDLVGYLILVCQENNWETFNEFYD